MWPVGPALAVLDPLSVVEIGLRQGQGRSGVDGWKPDAERVTLDDGEESPAVSRRRLSSLPTHTRRRCVQWG